MKRMARDPEKFGVLELFAAVARKKNLRLDSDEDFRKFADLALASLVSSQNSGTIIHGKRAEAMFAYIAGALGKCALIKVEDAGDMFVKGLPMQAPDYRLVLDDGSIILVEVKNFNPKDILEPFILTQKYYEKIQRYAATQRIPLKIAIYFPSLGFWCLVSPSAFKKTRAGLEITVTKALANNEMSTLGDIMIATLPRLRLEMMADVDEANEIDAEGKAIIIFRSGKIFCEETELHNEIDQRIAFYLMRFGRWKQKSWPVVRDNKLFGIVFTSSTDDTFEGQPFAGIGDLSSMIASAYSEYTVAEGKPFALDVAQDPEDFGLTIPHDFRSQQLPLWRFVLQPNPDFQDIPMAHIGK